MTTPVRPPKKLTARQAAFIVLLQAEREAAYVNLALKKLLDSCEISPADARLATQIVYGAARLRNALDHMIARLLSRPEAKLMTEARIILRLSLYQLHYLSKAEPYAVTDEAVRLAKKYANAPISRLVNAVLRNYLRLEDKQGLLPGPEQGFDYLHLTLSYPKWLADYFCREFGMEETARLCLALNENPGLFLRTNSFKLRREELQAALHQVGVESAPAGFSYETLQVLHGAGRLPASPAFRNGACIIQGPASQLAAHALSPASGSRVLDLCAAPGGKTTHLAAMMNDQGQVHAFDLHEHKLRLIEQNASRLGLSCITARQADAAQLPASYQQWADYILLDAPCSGLGVLNSRPDSRYHKQRDHIDKLAALSYQLLSAAAGYLRPGGSLLYSTCTLTHEENQDNVARFLAQRPDFSLQPMSRLAPLLHRPQDAAAALSGQLQLLPHIHGTEGFYLALLRKND